MDKGGRRKGEAGRGADGATDPVRRPAVCMSPRTTTRSERSGLSTPAFVSRGLFHDFSVQLRADVTQRADEGVQSPVRSLNCTGIKQSCRSHQRITTHLIEQDREESLQQEEDDPNREAPVQGRAFQEWRRILEGDDRNGEHDRDELDDGSLDDNGDEDAVARGGSRVGAVSSRTGAWRAGGKREHSLDTTGPTNDAVYKVKDELAVKDAPERAPHSILKRMIRTQAGKRGHESALTSISGDGDVAGVFVPHEVSHCDWFTERRGLLRKS